MEDTRNESRALLRWFALLSVLLPQACLWSLLFFVHHQRSAVLDAMGSALSGDKAILLSKGVSDFRSIYVLCSAAAAGLALLGFVLVLIAWSRARKRERISSLPLGAVGGLCLAHVLLGAGLAWRNLDLMRGVAAQAYADVAERTFLLGQVYESLPGLGPFVLASLVGLALAGLLAAVTVAKAERRLRPGGAAVIASLLVFLLGLAGFVATRDHAADADKTMSLLRGPPSAGEVIFVESDIDLPELKHGRDLEVSPVLIAGAGRVCLEGLWLGRMDEVAEGGLRPLSELSKRLARQRRHFEELHPEEDFPGRVILQCDRAVPGAAVASLLATCAEAGYRKIQIATGGLLRRDSAVLGAFVRYRPRGLTFDLVDASTEGALELPKEEPFAAWAARLDAAAARGELRVRLP
ncbi:MAG: hypothetical protein JXR96_13110 [Deltaproteobacteria bacterium]|nr:hypothetical protein [Deltaproteobacteria bacterium]